MSYEFNPNGPVAPYNAGGGQLFREDPGKTLGIVGFVLSFFVPVAGLICAIIGRNKSRAAGFQPSGLTTAGIVIGAIFTALGLLWFLFVGLAGLHGALTANV